MRNLGPRACKELAVQLEIGILSPWLLGPSPLIHMKLEMPVFISKDETILLVHQSKWQRLTWVLNVCVVQKLSDAGAWESLWTQNCWWQSQRLILEISLQHCVLSFSQTGWTTHRGDTTRSRSKSHPHTSWGFNTPRMFCHVCVTCRSTQDQCTDAEVAHGHLQGNSSSREALWEQV